MMSILSHTYRKWTAHQCNVALNGAPITMEQVLQEVYEFLEADELHELRDEMSDVIYFSLCWLEGKTGINLPMFGAKRTIAKIEARLTVWEAIFADQKLAFSPKYLVGGSNFLKPQKVEQAVSLARREQQQGGFY